MPEGPNLVRLSRLIKPSKLSGLFSFLDPVTDGLLGKVYFKDLEVRKSASGDAASYNLNIVLPRAVSVEILGTGMALVLNPSAEVHGSSEFNVSLAWKLPILAYVPDFDLEDFSFSPEDIVNLVLDVFQTSTEEILAGLAQALAYETFLPDLKRSFSVFNPLSPPAADFETLIDRINGDFGLYGTAFEIAYDPAYASLSEAAAATLYGTIAGAIEDSGATISEVAESYTIATDYPSGSDTASDILKRIPGFVDAPEPIGLEDLVTLLNEVFSLTGTSGELVYGESWTYSDLVVALTAADIMAVELLIKFIVDVFTDPSEILEALLGFFLGIVRDAFPGSFDDLLKVYFSTSVNDLALGLQFPRSWLIPLDQDGEPIADESVKSTLIFNLGTLAISTTDGLTLDEAGDFDFPASEIAGTGLTFSVSDLELDLSETANIAPADADGRPVSFKGVAIREVEIGLPKKWEKDESEGNAKIVGSDLVIGSEGGFSGKLTLDTSTSSLLRIDLPGEVKLGLDKFSMTFFQNAIKGVDITGYATLPALKDPETGEDGKVTIEIGFADEVYALSADTSGDGIPLKIGTFELYFKSFGIDFSKSGLVGVDLSGKMKLPGLKDSEGAAAEIDFSVDINEDGWKITAAEPEGVKLTVPQVVDIIIYSIEIGRKNKKIYVAISADFDLLIDVPVLGDLLPDKVLLEYFKIWQDGSTEDVDISVEWKSTSGVEVSAGGGELAMTIPVNKNLFNVAQLTKMDLILDYGGGGGIDFEALFSGSITLGPITGTVEKIGIGLEIGYSESGGNIGPLDITPRFVPPKGIGVAIDAGVVKGGGYIEFDPDNGRYVGMLELTIQELVSLKAIGILTTQMPDGSKGVTFFILITAEFSPLPLGFGFTLNGVGGLAGINRSMALDVMQKGLKTGALDSILFPSNVAKNAGRIISDIEEIFPIEEDRYVFGPMGIIGWGAPTLIELEFGLLLEVPNPIRLAILGALRMALPTEKAPILELNVAFLGILDIERKYLSFDASIYDSRVLTFTLEGDMAVRLTWGSDPNFLVSVGGFHPDYTPPPLNLPEDMKRITINLLTGKNPRLTLSAYFALTSNTVQFGARIELYIKVAKVFGKTLSIQGFAGFDALFQFSPIYFIIRVEAGLAVKYGGDAILSIYLGGSLEGPSRWRIQGKAQFKVLGLKFTAKVDKSFGKKDKTSLPNKEVTPELVQALADSRNWMPELPSAHGSSVTLKEIKVEEDVLLADPMSGLGVTQKVVPTGVKITKFGHYKPKESNPNFSITLHDSRGQMAISDHYEQFAPAQYFDKNEAQKLSGKNFENMKAGVRGQAGKELTGSRFVERPVEYDETIYDGSNKRRSPVKKRLTKAEFKSRLLGNALARSPLAVGVTSVLGPNQVTITPATYALVSRGDRSVFADTVTKSAIEAALALGQQVVADPTLSTYLQVMPAQDLNQL
ncbi:MAG: DUF6603 domain-containing protein [Bacteroidota bacterium]